MTPPPTINTNQFAKFAVGSLLFLSA